MKRGAGPKLEPYWRKRNFERTAEPSGDEGLQGRAGAPMFVVQKHDARRLHYDFRLELDGVLKSWAVPKGPSLDPAEKRLAVHTEDHPMAYADFEGVIPEKEYGAGTVIVWDRGSWEPAGDAAAGYRKGRLKFRLHGEKLTGGWTLARMGRAEEGKENWLLIKERDAAARDGAEAEVTERRPESVHSGRALGQVAGEPERVWHSDRALLDLAGVRGARKADAPEWRAPQLAMLADAPPRGTGWIYEIKYDGYRILARLSGGRARLYSRNGKDWTARLPAQARALAHLPASDAWLDGEVVVFRRDGTTSFQALQNAFKEGTAAEITYCLFDLPYLDGHDLSRVALLERKRLLERLVQQAGPLPALRYAEHLAGDGAASLQRACAMGLEGLIAKRADAPYTGARGRDWLKLKCRNRQEFAIVGYTDPGGSRSAFGALLLGVADEGGALRYAGRVGTGFDERTLADLLARLVPLEQRTSPLADPPRGAEARGVHWVRPALAAEVAFAEWTEEGLVRQASYLGLREDKPGTEAAREQPPPALASQPPAPPRVDDRAATVVAGVKLTNPDKLLYPAAGLTKRDLAEFYESISPWILPHLKDRPLSLVRCPEGAEGHCFFQKHATAGLHDAVEQVQIEEKDGSATYLVANSASALVSLAQMGVLELHTWGATMPRIERPDRITFDLDPDEGLPWARTVEAARLTRGLLQELGLESALKTTGGKGLHVVVPLARSQGWDEVKAFSRAVAEHLARALPQRFTANLAKNKRTGRVFIDYLRNAPGATAVAAYSTRAKPGAPVSVPIAWEELDDDLRSDAWTVTTLPRRMAALRADPWVGLRPQRISAAARAKLGLRGPA